MSVEKEIKLLEDEIKALKATFEKTALQLPVITKSIYFATSKNTCTVSHEGDSFSFEAAERVVVTFATSTGANTLATLEMTSNNDSSNLKIKRVPYSDGARWIIYCDPKYDSNYNWVSTSYSFIVHSAVDGTLGAKMIWQ